VKKIAADTLEALRKMSPAEAAIWDAWIASGEACIV